MPELLERTRQLLLRLVYFGPPGSGKAANLQRIHDLLPPEVRSRMKAFDAGPERTVSFEMSLPSESAAGQGWTVQVTVAGCSSPLHKPTKVAIVEGADAIAFVADGSRSRREENHEAFREAEDLLRVARRRPPPPIVLQVNKRDKSDAISDEEIEAEWGARSWPIFTAVAKQGEGVRETFTCLLRLAFEAADRAAGVEARTGLTLSGVTASALKALRQPQVAPVPAKREESGSSPKAPSAAAAKRENGDRT